MFNHFKFKYSLILMKQNIKLPNLQFKNEKRSFAIKSILKENKENKKSRLISSKFYYY